MNRNLRIKEIVMSTKTLLKFGVAFGILAIVLIFLGVNFVPRIQAFSSAKGNIGESAIQVRPDYVDEAFPRAIVPQLSYVRSVRPIGTERFFTPPPMSKYVRHYGTERFFTPPPISNYIRRPVGTERFFTPPPADYTP